MANRPNLRRILEILCILIAVSRPAFSQETFKTTAPCSPISQYNNGTIVIQCAVNSDKMAKQLIEILNRIERNQLDPKLVMSKLDEIEKGVNAVQEHVNPNVPKITYTKGGVKRMTSPGRSVASIEAVDTFRELAELYDGRQWAKLVQQCEDQIKQRPEWFTPYVLGGLAYVNLGNRAKAIELLEEARSGMDDNPDYENLPEIVRDALEKIKE